MNCVWAIPHGLIAYAVICMAVACTGKDSVCYRYIVGSELDFGAENIE